jgi:hypothetical protein
MSRLLPVFGLVGIALGPLAPHAEASILTQISQARTVSAHASVSDPLSGVADSDSPSDTAVDFGSFGVTAIATFGGVDASAQAKRHRAPASLRAGAGAGKLGIQDLVDCAVVP